MRGDPERAAEIIVRTVKRHDLPSHLVLGASAVTSALEHSRRQIAEAGAWAEVSRSADCEQPYPVDIPHDEDPDSGDASELAR